jgi:hypothetical protein
LEGRFDFPERHRFGELGNGQLRNEGKDEDEQTTALIHEVIVRGLLEGVNPRDSEAPMIRRLSAYELMKANGLGRLNP